MQAIDQAPEDAQQRAVYLCNAAACYLKKEMWQLAAEQCTQALKLNENYLKVSSSLCRKFIRYKVTMQNTCGELQKSRQVGGRPRTPERTQDAAPTEQFLCMNA